MTVAIGFLCHDGVVIGADSMLTSTIGGMAVGHHKGQKVHLLSGEQVFAFAGDQGQASRLQFLADGFYQRSDSATHAIHFPLSLTKAVIEQFHQTGIGNQINLNALLGFVHGGYHHLCAFEGVVQPRLLDSAHFYVALGNGKLSADPFLRFLVDIFCANGPPSVAEAIFLTAWAIKHVCNVNPGGVAPPTRIAVMELKNSNFYCSRTLSANEVDDQGERIESAMKALTEWRASLIPSNVDAAMDAAIPPAPMGLDSDQYMSQSKSDQ
jgi:hypothetical protein